MTNFSNFANYGYQISRELGRNREAGRITYLATNLNTGVQVVIKEFRFAMVGADWSGFKAYEREIEVLQNLEHSRIPRYLNYFETSVGFCLVQEYKNAPSLAERRIYYPEQIKQIAVSVLEILVDLQKRIPPVIHRDIKPENILVDNQQNAYLVDFGLARVQSGKVALSSVAAGTPGFMPPEEQFGRPLTEASDLYSLGVTVICLVTGTRSVDVGNLIDDNYRFDFKKLVPQLSPRFVEWLTKMVEPNLKNRYPNAAVALEALKLINVVDSTNWLEILVSRIKLTQLASFVGLAAIGSLALIGTNFIFNNQKAVKVHNSNSLKSNMLSPVALWNFDLCSEPGKPMLANELGAQTKGAMVRGVICEKGRFGQAAFFDGVDDLIEISDQPQFHFTNQMAVAAWVKPLRLNNPPYGLQTIVNKWYAMDSYMLLIENGNFVFTVAFPGGQWGTPVKVSAPATLGVWTHVAGVFNGEMLLLYINGKLAATTTATGTLQYSDRPISIGNHPSWNAFYGFIDEVSLYDVALNAMQIEQLASQF